MQQAATCAPVITVDTVVAAIVAVGTVGAALTALGIQVARNVKDLRAAWAQIHLHEKVLNGAIEAHRRAQGS